MIAFMRSAILLLILIASPANAQKTTADYDHTDPVVRGNFFDYLDRLANEGEKRRYIDVAFDLIPHWQQPAQSSDLRRLCHGMFGMLISAEILEKYLDLAAGCPQDQRDLMAGKVDREPVPAFFVAPKFKKKNRKPGTREEIIVSFSISPEGEPGKVAIVRSTSKSLNRAIRRAARKARFLPAIRDQLPVVVPVYFVRYEVIQEPGVEVMTLITVIGSSLELGSQERLDGCIVAPWDPKQTACD